MTRRASVPAAVVAVAASVVAHAANWPQWRGPGGQGISDEDRIPLEWSSTRNVAWKIAVSGQGHSQPIVWDSRVFLTLKHDSRADLHTPRALGREHLSEGGRPQEVVGLIEVRAVEEIERLEA
jgi:hypothetical protein